MGRVLARILLVSAAAGLFQINHWIETAPTPLPSNAEIVNARDVLLVRARKCERERGMLPNIVAVDFYRSGDLFGVVDVLNGVGVQPRGVRIPPVPPRARQLRNRCAAFRRRPLSYFSWPFMFVLPDPPGVAR